MTSRFSSYVFAFFAVLLWASLASFSQFVLEVPALLLTGISLIIGSLISLPKIKMWNWNWRSIAFGTYGIAGFHIFYFLGLRNAPPIETNLVNYLWPLLIILFSPVFLKKKLSNYQIAGAILGFSGAFLAISSKGFSQESAFQIGYLFSFFSAIIWSTYSLGLSKAKHSVWQNGVYCFISGILCLTLSFLTEPTYLPTKKDWLILLLIGIGPLGASFYLWDYSIKKIGAVAVAPISYLTPVISTGLLSIALYQVPSNVLLLAVLFVIAGVILGNRK